MGRKLTAEEYRLVLKLVGPDFEEIETIKSQLDAATVDHVSDGYIIEFGVLQSRPLKTKKTVLGEGSVRDIDDVPIVITLLQKEGYIWRLDITRADSDVIKAPINYESVVALGFNRGLSLAG